MGKLIYLVSLLEGVDFLSTLLAFITVPVTVYIMYRHTKVIESEGEVDEVKANDDLIKMAKKGVFVLILSIIISLLIPSKENMYLIALTKDYGKEELYQMSKNEIKDSVDYIFDKVKELKDE